jgi:hypothetical protein
LWVNLLINLQILLYVFQVFSEDNEDCASFLNESPGMHGENHLLELIHHAGINVVLLQGADLG